MDHVECIVVGAGVVGLSVAAALCRRGMETIVVERHSRIGSEVSSRNSEVVHAGIYYPRGSLKAQLCVEGKALLYQYCKTHSIPHQRIGKFIVATEEREIPAVRRFIQQAWDNGVDDLVWLDADEIMALEPALRCRGGAASPSTGIVDTHALMQCLQGDLEEHGGAVSLNTLVSSISSSGPHPTLETEDYGLSADWIINCGGLNAPALARDIPGSPDTHYAKGHYYAYAGRSPFSRLIYPIPQGSWLGVHATLDLAGQLKFGPDLHWVDSVDYSFDPAAYPAFVSAIRRYYPSLDESRLHQGYTAIRPKIAGPSDGFTDFRIDGPRQHGVRGRINLLGIESPGLTSALAIANRVESMVLDGP